MGRDPALVKFRSNAASWWSETIQSVAWMSSYGQIPLSLEDSLISEHRQGLFNAKEFVLNEAPCLYDVGVMLDDAKAWSRIRIEGPWSGLSDGCR